MTELTMVMLLDLLLPLSSVFLLDEKMEDLIMSNLRESKKMMQNRMRPWRALITSNGKMIHLKKIEKKVMY